MWTKSALTCRRPPTFSKRLLIRALWALRVPDFCHSDRTASGREPPRMSWKKRAALERLNFLLGDGRVSGSRRGGLSGKNSSKLLLFAQRLGLGLPFHFRLGLWSALSRFGALLAALGFEDSAA